MVWASGFLADFRSARSKAGEIRGVQLREVAWKAPSIGFVKINTDAALDEVHMVSGVGVVIRD